MPELYEYEVGEASDILVRELYQLKAGETFVITADTESDRRVVDATARDAFAVGAKPMVIWLPSPLGVGNIGAILIPPDGIPAPSHSDGICLNTSVWLAGEQVLDRGKVVYRDLVKLVRKLGMS